MEATPPAVHSTAAQGGWGSCFCHRAVLLFCVFLPLFIHLASVPWAPVWHLSQGAVGGVAVGTVGGETPHPSSCSSPFAFWAPQQLLVSSSVMLLVLFFLFLVCGQALVSIVWPTPKSLSSSPVSQGLIFQSVWSLGRYYITADCMLVMLFL